MSTADSPDFQTNVVSVTETGEVPDAPDFTTVVVGPGGTPVGPPPGGGLFSPYYIAGLKAATVDPAACTQVTGHTAGNIALTVFTPFASFTANYVYFIVGGASGLTPNENYMGVYDMGVKTANTMTLLSATAAGVCDTAFASNGYKKVALTPAVTLQDNANYAFALLNNGASPSFDFAEPNNSATPNPLSTNYPFRSFTTSTFTTLPSTIAYSAVTLTGVLWMFFLSDT